MGGTLGQARSFMDRVGMACSQASSTQEIPPLVFVSDGVYTIHVQGSQGGAVIHLQALPPIPNAQATSRRGQRSCCPSGQQGPGPCRRRPSPSPPVRWSQHSLRTSPGCRRARPQPSRLRTAPWRRASTRRRSRRPWRGHAPSPPGWPPDSLAARARGGSGAAADTRNGVRPAGPCWTQHARAHACLGAGAHTAMRCSASRGFCTLLALAPL